MHDAGAILRSAFHRTLEDLREQYQHLWELEPLARARLVSDANAELDTVQTAIISADTLRAKDVLIFYQYATRFDYNFDEQSQRYFVDSLKRLWRDHESDIANWRWQAPTKDEFLCAMQSRLPSVDFYTQVNLLCDELFGLPLPATPETSLADWSTRAGIAEEGWAWRYNNQVKDEKARWFSSQKRVNAIEAQRAEHRAKACRLLDQITPIFLELNSAKSKLEDLKRKQLWFSGRCFSLNRANDAINQGVQLKHLLLEEAHGLDQTFKAATRGL